MTPTRIILRGYAVPFGQVAHIGSGKLEQFAAGAFSEMLARPRAIDLRWETHGEDAPRLASSTAGSLSFFADSYGLGFLAKLSMKDYRNWSRLQMMMQKTRPMSLVSVGGLTVKASRREHLQLGTTEVITSAAINHVTICNDAAYRRTGVWPTHVALDAAPYRIQELDARWREGRAAWDHAQAAQRRAEASLRPIGRTIGGHIVMVAPNGRLHVKHGVTGRLIQ